MIKIFFSSKGRTATDVATTIQEILKIESGNVVNLSIDDHRAEDFDFDLAIFICPTYGDEELEARFENFLIQSNWLCHQNKKFAVIELGLYRGYDFVNLGSARIIQQYLEANQLKLSIPVLSLDSVPTYNNAILLSWLNKYLKNE